MMRATWPRTGVVLDSIVAEELVKHVVSPVIVNEAEDAGFEVVVWLCVDLDAAHHYDLSVLDELVIVDDTCNIVADMLEHDVRDFGGMIFSRCNALLVFVAEEFDVVHLDVVR